MRILVSSVALDSCTARVAAARHAKNAVVMLFTASSARELQVGRVGPSWAGLGSIDFLYSSFLDIYFYQFESK